MERLKSRKLWVTIGAGAVVVLAKQYGIELDEGSLIAIATMVIGYVTGQAIVDRGKVVAEVQGKVPALVSALQDALETIEAIPEDPDAGYR